MRECKRCGEEMKDLGDLFGFRCPCCEPGFFRWLFGHHEEHRDGEDGERN